MRATIRMLGATAAAVAVTLALSACLFSPRVDPDSATLTPRPDPSRIEPSTAPASPGPSSAPASPGPSAGRLIDCAGADVRISEPGREFTVTGSCPLVEIEGADLEVAFVDATVDDVVIRGDRVELDAGDIDSLSISGNDNSADAAGLGALEIRGDRNEVEVAGRVGAVTIGGSDNEVGADSVGAVSVQGSGNQVGPHR